MGFSDKLRYVFGMDDEDYEDEEEYEEENEEYEDEKTLVMENIKDSGSNKEKAGKKGNYDVEKPASFNFPSTTRSFTSAGNLRFVLSKPQSFEEATEIADNINIHKTVIINLEGCDKNVSRRLLDFVSGVAYTNKATIQKIANSTFIVIPENAEVSGFEVSL